MAFKLIVGIACLAAMSFSAKAALVSYSVYGEVTSSNILDGGGNSVIGKIARFDFEFDDILSTTYVTGTSNASFTVGISVAGTYNSITTSTLIFESWNDAFDAQMYSDSFNGGNPDMYLSFDSIRLPSQSRPDVFGPGENVSVPGGPFNFDIGSVVINGGINLTMKPAAVPLPAAVWLFGSGLIGLIGFAKRKKA